MKHAKQSGMVETIKGKAGSLRKALMRLDRKLFSPTSEGQNNVSQDLSTSNCNAEKYSSKWKLFNAGPISSGSISPRGQLPLEVSAVDVLGNVHSNTTFVLRDLGFSGELDHLVILSYGDTLWTNASYDTSVFRGLTSDSMALATSNPLVVVDVGLNSRGYPNQFCPIMKEYGEDPDIDAMGITNVVEVCPGLGILYFLKNHRPNNVNNLIGAGVANVTITQPSNSTYPVPKATRLSEYWWDAKKVPWYGDVGAIKAGDYIYSYGHAESNPWVYVARVPTEHAFELSEYEYWNGENWQKELLTDFGEKESVFWQVNQGQVIWSNYYGCFVFVYADSFVDSKIQAKVAYLPEGPWSDPVELFQATPITPGGAAYAAAPQPYFDKSGKTLVVTFTNLPNVIQAIRVASDTVGSSGHELTNEYIRLLNDVEVSTEHSIADSWRSCLWGNNVGL
ncbi:MAG: hypothetical protein Q9160_008514 [Pyrenula sp. 1 TL-2023]